MIKKILPLIALIVFLSALSSHAQQVGNPAPDFEANLEGGGTFKLSDQDGKVVFIFLFGNTCPSCIAAGPSIESTIHQAFVDDPDYVAVGLDIWNGSELSVTSFRNQTGISFPLGLQSSGVAAQYGTTYDRLLVVDAEGVLVHKGLGGASGDINNAKQAIEAALAEITDPCEEANLNITSIVSDPSCFGESDGMVDVTVTGNYPTFSFDWSTGASTEDLSGLSAGTYDLTVTDMEGCTAAHQVTLVEPDLLTISETTRELKCADASDGMIRIQIAGGTAPYQIKWPDNSTLDSISGLSEGCYLVEVTDANGCVAEKEICLVAPEPLMIDDIVRHPDCNGEMDGMIRIEVSGGTAPYQIKWPDNTTLDSISGLGEGCYLVEVTDANGCTIEKEICVVDPDPIMITETVYSPGCTDDSTGSIKIEVSGGMAPYQILWSDDSSSDSISGLALGCYTVEVTDAKGCVVQKEICVDAITIAETVVHPTCHGDSTGSIEIDISGGLEPYAVSWFDGSTQNSVAGLGEGCYLVQVTDSDNCSSEKEICLIAPDNITIGEINGETAPAAFSTHSYNLPQQTGYQYQWMVTGGDIVSGQGTHMVEVQWADSEEGMLKSVAFSDAQCMSDTAILSVAITNTTGFAEDGLSSIRIFPNPVTDVLMIESSNPFSMEIYDVTGKRIIVTKENRVNLSSLPRGTYIVVLQSRNEVIRLPLMKQ